MMPMAKKRGSTVFGVRIGLKAITLELCFRQRGGRPRERNVNAPGEGGGENSLPGLETLLAECGI